MVVNVTAVHQLSAASRARPGAPWLQHRSSCIACQSFVLLPPFVGTRKRELHTCTHSQGCQSQSDSGSWHACHSAGQCSGSIRAPLPAGWTPKRQFTVLTKLPYYDTMLQPHQAQMSRPRK